MLLFNPSSSFNNPLAPRYPSLLSLTSSSEKFSLHAGQIFAKQFRAFSSTVGAITDPWLSETDIEMASQVESQQAYAER
jgi:hypothetical protein